MKLGSAAVKIKSYLFEIEMNTQRITIKITNNNTIYICFEK